MDKSFILQHLPEEPPKGLLPWALKNTGGELDGEYCIYHSERVPVMPDIAEIMEYNSLAPKRKVWAAVCTCTACQGDFITQKEPGENAIRVVQSEDGMYYTCEVEMPVDPYMGVEINRDGDSFRCPLCDSEVMLIHQKKLRGGRLKQIMTVTVQNIQSYTAIIYWLISRTIDEDGLSEYAVHPYDAFVLTENGGIVRYSHHKTGAYGCHYAGDFWRWNSNDQDSIDDIYHDWGSINNKKCGAFIYGVYPDLEGNTGEKTGLVEYLKANGYRPVAYLKAWRKYRNLENLCKTGQAHIVASIVSQAYRYSSLFDFEAAKYIDLEKSKPHEMLRLSKAEYKELRQRKIAIKLEHIEKWAMYQDVKGKLSFGTFLVYLREYGLTGINAAMQIMRFYGGTDLDKLSRYLKKQGLSGRDAGQLLDTRDMARKLYGHNNLTAEELWPQRLHATHDRLSQMLAEKIEKEKVDTLKFGFQRMIDKYGHLQWTDGELCIILPRENSDLVREGKVLRHCVGGYGMSHAEGKSLIFFVRRYRRQERPYYTLNIRMTERPEEVQLHGYGNEHHGKYKEHTHTIPKKVRAFCDRWENEILLPWYAEKQRQQKEEMSA